MFSRPQTPALTRALFLILALVCPAPLRAAPGPQPWVADGAVIDAAVVALGNKDGVVAWLDDSGLHLHQIDVEAHTFSSHALTLPEGQALAHFAMAATPKADLVLALLYQDGSVVLLRGSRSARRRIAPRLLYAADPSSPYHNLHVAADDHRIVVSLVPQQARFPALAYTSLILDSDGHPLFHAPTILDATYFYPVVCDGLVYSGKKHRSQYILGLFPGWAFAEVGAGSEVSDPPLENAFRCRADGVDLSWLMHSGFALGALSLDRDDANQRFTEWPVSVGTLAWVKDNALLIAADGAGQEGSASSLTVATVTPDATLCFRDELSLVTTIPLAMVARSIACAAFAEAGVCVVAGPPAPSAEARPRGDAASAAALDVIQVWPARAPKGTWIEQEDGRATTSDFFAATASSPDAAWLRLAGSEIWAEAAQLVAGHCAALDPTEAEGVGCAELVATYADAERWQEAPLMQTATGFRQVIQSEARAWLIEFRGAASSLSLTQITHKPRKIPIGSQDYRRLCASVARHCKTLTGLDKRRCRAVVESCDDPDDPAFTWVDASLLWLPDFAISTNMVTWDADLWDDQCSASVVFHLRWQRNKLVTERMWVRTYSRE